MRGYNQVFIDHVCIKFAGEIADVLFKARDSWRSDLEVAELLLVEMAGEKLDSRDRKLLDDAKKTKAKLDYLLSQCDLHIELFGGVK